MKFNLIIDGNYVLNKLIFPLIKNNMLYGELENALNAMLKQHRSLYFFDNIFFVSDGGTSWRKNIYPAYKGKRKKDDKVDWEFIYNVYNKFKDNLPKNVTKLEATSIEGDDWIYQISKITNDMGMSNLIITGDHDMKQLLKLEPYHDSYIMNMMSNEMYNNETVFIPNNYELYLANILANDKNSLFNLTENGELHAFIKSFLSRRKVVKTDRIESLVNKVITGDTSDNITSVYTKVGSTGKISGIGKAGGEKIYALYVKEYDIITEDSLKHKDFISNLVDVISEVKKAPETEARKIYDAIEKNMDLVCLDLLPNEITAIMNKEINKIMIK